MQTVEELDVFKLLHEMALVIYKITKTFPEDERFGLSSQMRRASYSIPMNIAEGAGRLNTGEYRQFVGVARGSTSELKYQLLLARDLGYIHPRDHEDLRNKCERISQMLTALAKSLAGK